jgi:hypothetical protein
MNIVFDIETLPCNDPEVIAELTATIKPPGNIKKAESIAEWMRENREAAAADLVARTSFDGMYGRICCISYAIDDDAPISVFGNEHKLIADFFAAVDAASTSTYRGFDVYGELVFVGHNIASFDLPFLKHRAIIHGIKPPAVLLNAMNAKPWDACIADTMLMWSQDREKRASMNKLCKAFGISGKDGFDGSMVADTWPVDPMKVVSYCEDDVLRTREMYRRMMFLDCPPIVSATTQNAAAQINARAAEDRRLANILAEEQAARAAKNAEFLGETVAATSATPESASAPATPVDIRAAVVEHQDEISSFLDTRYFKDESRIRAILVEFVKHQAAFNLRKAA